MTAHPTPSPQRRLTRACALALTAGLLCSAQAQQVRTNQAQGISVAPVGPTQDIPALPPKPLGESTGTVSYSSIEQLIGSRYTNETSLNTDAFLKGICPDEGFSALMPNEFKAVIGAIKPDFSIDGLESMVDGMCRIKNTHNEVLRVLNQNDWATTGRLAIDTLLGRAGVSAEQSGPVLDEVFRAIQNGSVDTMEAITRIASGYTANKLATNYQLEPGTSLEVDSKGTLLDPGVKGILTPDGKLDTDPMDEAIFDRSVMSSLDNGRDALNGLGTVFSYQESDVQSMEASARRMKGIVESAYTVLGDDSNIGAIEERVQASQQATSLREQMIAQVQATTDQTRLFAESNVSILGQLVENARVNSNTNQLLALQAKKMYDAEMKEVDESINAYKAKIARETQELQDTSDASLMIHLQYLKSLKGSGMTNFQWSDIRAEKK